MAPVPVDWHSALSMPHSARSRARRRRPIGATAFSRVFGFDLGEPWGRFSQELALLSQELALLWLRQGALCHQGCRPPTFNYGLERYTRFDRIPLRSAPVILGILQWHDGCQC